MQLTHCGNYKGASQDLYGDDRLVQNPDLVMESPASMDTAMWFWKNQVGETGKGNDFGATTAKINKYWDCEKHPEIGKARFEIAQQCFKEVASDLVAKITNDGCK